ncbi:poly(ethylene terephthalate) hydrolase family protein [Paenibacillus spongiae]|uniref:Alpha/beta hydrolase n=1 Tax=Paenibacillus spongiae TaxID=2909671 RepID=A0ABY5S2Y6_9BACL|nr:alpha/beta hydrolase [Paenibacillus spongiae]UVI28237.1 alpha/beta hydrolase [Paenibacillus spongiae]
MNINVRVNVRSGLHRFWDWLIGRTLTTLDGDTPFWRNSVIGIWAVYAASLVVTALGMPTGLGIMFDTFTAGLLGTIAMLIGGGAAAFILSLMYVPVPRFFAGSFIYSGLILYTILYYADMGLYVSVILAVILTLSGALLGLILAAFLHPRWSATTKLSALTTAAVLLLAFVIFTDKGKDDTAIPALATSDTASAPVVPLALDNPAAPGAYDVQDFTYGSGNDRHRDEFARDADLISDSVDASAYITRWSWIRSLFWGFDEKELPVNGRVWMPEGDGPFPLVLIVHGNHLMEQFSDTGYAYLGELLASRGFITVSVDENFLNYSVWGGIPNQDMKVRAWMMLKHVQQLADYNEQEETPLYNRIDLDRVAMIGHSRGGQAAAMAADSNRWFASDETLEGLDDVGIQAVVAIAPTDKQVDKTSAVLKDTYYLTIQGAMDGDVNNFYGDRQYMRTSFRSDSDRFKASLYIGEANHSLFNTSWGSMDDSLPGGLLLNREMMDPEDQREAAKVYVSAFLEAALNGNKAYVELFQDYRKGSDWLPEATYVNRFESGRFTDLARFDEDRDKTAVSGKSKVEAKGVQWTESDALDRERQSKGTRGVTLEWDEGQSGSYTIALSDIFRNRLARHERTVFSFSLANLERDIWQEGAEFVPHPDVEVELETLDGSRVTLPLTEFMPVGSPPSTEFTIASWMERRIKDGKYKESTEPVFQTYRLPLERFEQAGFSLQASELAAVTFHLQGGPGKIMLDDIGFTD